MHGRGQHPGLGNIIHIYNSGAHGLDVFASTEDLEYFQLLLYLANDSGPVELSDLLVGPYKHQPLSAVYAEKPDQSLVAIEAYSIVPNQFHILLRQRTSGGVEGFMRKLGTGYAMRYNARYLQRGALFKGRYERAAIVDPQHMRYLFAAMHLQVLQRIEPKWKEEGIANTRSAQSFLDAYEFSSWRDYRLPTPRVQGAILESLSLMQESSRLDLSTLLRWYSSYKNS